MNETAFLLHKSLHVLFIYFVTTMFFSLFYASNTAAAPAIPHVSKHKMHEQAIAIIFSANCVMSHGVMKLNRVVAAVWHPWPHSIIAVIICKINTAEFNRPLQPSQIPVKLYEALPSNKKVLIPQSKHDCTIFHTWKPIEIKVMMTIAKSIW